MGEEQTTKLVNSILEKLAEFQKEKGNQHKKQFLIGIAGIPGGGKSTLTSKIINFMGADVCQIVPMDGYHLYRKELTQEQMARRGAPDTFNKIKFREDLIKLRQESEGSFPSFDHAVKDPVENDIQITKQAQVIIVEGLYLFMKDWNLLELFDMKIFMQCDQDEADERVAKRNFEAGIYPTLEAATIQVKNNDRVNAIYIRNNSEIDQNTCIFDTSEQKKKQ